MNILHAALHHQALIFIPIVLVVVMFVFGDFTTTMAQSGTTAKPGATEITTAGQKPGTKETTAPPITGTIRGRLSANDGQPLLNANVMVQSLTGTPMAKPGRPDAEGRFVFEDLAPGAYIVMGTAPGYIDQSMSLGNPFEWPRHLIGSDVKVNMIKGGVITGLVTNEKGEPMVGVPVHATMTNLEGSTILGFFTGGGVGETDDRGVYRVYGLMPGQYTVNAGGKGVFGQFAASGFDIDVPTYYPSTTRDTAVPLSVRSGDETAGIDIKYKGAEGHSIGGVVLGDIPASATPGAVTIMLAHSSTRSILGVEIAGTADPRRAFSFNGIADGEYDLFASYLTDPKENALIGTKRITVRGGDMTGIELRLAALGSVAGTITLDPIKPEDKCDRRGSQVIETILKFPHDDPKKASNQPLLAMYAGLGQLTEKGEFSLRNLEAAKYRLDLKLPSENWYIRNINLPAAAARVTPAPSTTPAAAPAQPTVAGPTAVAWQGILTLRPGETLGGISIMVGQDAAIFRGRISTEGTVIQEGTRVHLVPVEREQANNVLRYSEMIVKRDGTFAFTNLAPGRYFVLSRIEPATEEASPRPLAWDPAMRTKLRREAEAAKIEVELKPCQSIVDYSLKPGAVR